MLKQVLQQVASKQEAKSNQSQRQSVASRLLVSEMHGETSHHVVTLVDVRAPLAAAVAPVEPRDVMMTGADW